METSSEATSKTVGLYSPVVGCTSACIPAHLLRQTSRCFTDNSNEPRSSPPIAIRYQSVSCRLHSKYISVSASLHLKTKWNETLENELVPKRIRRCSVRYYKTPSEKSCVKRRGARAQTHTCCCWLALHVNGEINWCDSVFFSLWKRTQKRIECVSPWLGNLLLRKKK